MNVLVNENTMKGIADSIRAKTGKSGSLKPAAMAAEIDSISGEGGGGAPAADPNKPVHFVDIEGNLLYSYTLDELQQINALPDPPDYEGLISEGWNWSLEGLKRQNSPMDVGPVYIPSGGKTLIYVRIIKGRQKPILSYTQSSTMGAIVDWGDGSEEDYAWESGAVSLTHEYLQPGSYVISISPQGGGFLTFKGDSAGGSLLTSGLTEYAGKDALDSTYRNSVTAIRLGERVKIGDRAFSSFMALESITIANEVREIGKNVFYGTNALKCLIFPLINNIAPEHFASHVDALKVVSLPEDLKTVSKYSFAYDHRLERVCFPNSITTIGENCMHNCSGLREIHLPSGLETLGPSVVADCPVLHELILPEGLKALGESALSDCTGLCSLCLPTSINSISDGAIGFTGLKELYVYAENPPEIGDMFYSMPSPDLKIYVPAGCLETYRAAEIWSDLADMMVEMEA